jgi:hypothetical protein
MKEPEKKEESEQKPGASDDNEISISDDETEVKEPVVKEQPAVKQEPVIEKEPEVKPLPPDDWAPKGQFTAILAASARQTVYYIEDEAKLLDTFAIMRTSGKGCDASNLYDEEVLTSNDMYFSDDEQEREFKNRGKKKGGKNQRKDRSQTSHGQQPNIPGFHPPAQQQQAPQHIPGFYASARPPPPPPLPRQPFPQAMGQQATPYYPYPQQGNVSSQLKYQQYSQQHVLVLQGYPPQAYQSALQQRYAYPPQGGGAQPFTPAPYPYILQFQQQQPYQQQ